MRDSQWRTSDNHEMKRHQHSKTWMGNIIQRVKFQMTENLDDVQTAAETPGENKVRSPVDQTLRL